MISGLSILLPRTSIHCVELLMLTFCNSEIAIFFSLQSMAGQNRFRSHLLISSCQVSQSFIFRPAFCILADDWLYKLRRGNFLSILRSSYVYPTLILRLSYVIDIV